MAGGQKIHLVTFEKDFGRQHYELTMPNTWLTIDQVALLSGWSKRHIRRLASASRIQTRDKRELCIPGKPAREYALSSLPVEAQLKFLKQPLL